MDLGILRDTYLADRRTAHKLADPDDEATALACARLTYWTDRMGKGTVLYASRKTLESVGADVDISWNPFVSQITAYSSAITLGDGKRNGHVKKIYNDGTGSNILVNCALPGTDTQVSIDDDRFCVLIWAAAKSHWRLYDGISGITLQ
uniref:Uncharacterized protein n=1 Tax=Marseillevirus LCMAC103 TaxID=2506604 RepID=A0A481YWY3_9VIRU|nr:MAG: hypothetical protein LCMAC103_03800 [Marseillevirus LCMAC103]